MTRIVTPFGADATADEVSEGIDLSGNRAIVTGGASGIGIETARTLARRGARVTLAVRDVVAARRVAAEIVADTEYSEIDVRELDLTDTASVRAFVDAWDEPLDLLVNNAGVMAIQELTLVENTWERQFATNFLGHFALTTGLHDALRLADGARVVSVASSAHLFSPIVFDDIDFRFRPYDPLQAYGQSKTAVVLFGVAATSRWADDGITVNSVNPGAIATSLQRHVGGTLATPIELQKTPAQGASTSVMVATSGQLDGIGGRYFNDNREAIAVDHRPTDITELANSVASYALDLDVAERLWAIAARAVE
ncbi:MULTISPECIES: SDR family NAD(P)-dependent oxidoreductase [Rhodococcus]|jgi:NAD(P)-dependent dehydrogenase (short-subunit alcohol dehydrogenase family)|uniref:SDR family NAD(P)-dependent oxidoreductase n=1 Tax=Rhodococcus cercidiphylli TaxID=489916 RepID=A0ABU4B4E5_9NOCA|nr:MULTISPECIES: SDR family NAD(P)-dependent oxidoreductase [Rhodococcus]KAA0926303.1 SDR family NAD(P)-dependent oxidoreductase [Rhodococcus sp. ANT_H53B]MDI9924441.1 SDR family NAD(P)-dependent oxidoreductase [Rhodococcus sp. IEGM 1341]MDV6233365.1 SDR family NAD(P)-dependent oxidoreductase [Rhodococcus cercidiphylli]MDV8057105.1 SDR family NAD(P)-dependent oxidoreductase [Rhodococcus sp. IEGM 1343]